MAFILAANLPSQASHKARRRAVLLDSQNAASVKTLNWATASTLMPNAKALHIEAVQLHLICTATVAVRGIIIALYQDGVPSFPAVLYQCVGDPATPGFPASTDIWLHGAMNFNTADVVQAPAMASTLVGGDWDGTSTQTFPLPENLFLSEGSTLHFEVSNWQTSDTLHVTLTCSEMKG